MSKTNKLNKAEMAALIDETRQELNNLMKSETAQAALLAKGDGPPPDDKKEDSGPPPDDSSSSDSAGGPPPPDASSAPPPDASASPAPPAGPPDASASAGAPPDASAPPAGDPAASANPADSVETLKAAYAQLPPEALKAHFMALKEVIAASMAPAAPMAGAPPADPMAGAMGAPPAASASPAPPPMAPAASASPAPMAPPVDPMAMKNEKELLEKLAKFEARFADQEKSLGSVIQGFEILMRKPERKAIRGKDIAGLAKSEPTAVDVSKLSRPELLKKCSELASNPDLKKSDRDLITRYVSDRQAKSATLQVLFDKK